MFKVVVVYSTTAVHWHYFTTTFVITTRLLAHLILTGHIQSFT